jgi:hypothetical protein
VEESHNPSREWIDGRQIGTLVEIASVTGQGEVQKSRRAAVLSGYDVLDLERLDKGVSFRQPAVFTAVVCTPPNSLTLGSIHQGLRLLRKRRALD